MLRKILLLLLTAAPALEAFVEGDLTQRYEISPGEEKSGRIRLRNDSGKPMRYQIKQADWRFLYSGESHFDPPGTNPRSNAGWVRLSSSFLELPPGAAEDLYYTIKAPDSFTGKGAFWSLFLIEREEEERQPVSGGIAVKVRYANLVLTSFDGGEAQLRFLKVGKDEKGFLRLDVENSGETFMEPELVLRLFDEKGAPLDPVTLPKEKILPGCSVRYRIDMARYGEAPLKGFAILADKKGGQFAERISWPD